MSSTMAPASLSIPEALRIIRSQEDISISIKRSAIRIFRHEIERPDPKTKRAVSPRQALNRTLSWMIVQQEKEDLSFKLNPIQKKLLYLIIVEGFTQNQAALELNRARDTVKQYIRDLRLQLGVDSFYQVVAIAVERGWVPPPSVSPKR